MLSDEQQYVLGLLRHALGGCALPTVPEGLDAWQVKIAISRGGILPTVYPSLGGLPQVQRDLMQEYYASVSQIVNQNLEGCRVLSALCGDGMRCIGMKGWEIRRLYPNITMRQMTDLDVLVRPYNYARVRDVMSDLGFLFQGEEHAEKHDIYCKGVVTVEVHKRIRDDVAAVRDWESRMWERATCDDDGVWRVSPEDSYLMHFEHMYHDFRNGWFGLRRVVDAWLLDRQWDEMDTVYVLRELEAMGIARFRAHMCRLARACMGEEPIGANEEELLRFAFGCGIYGNGKSYKAGRIVSMTGGSVPLAAGKVRTMTAHLFPPLNRMKAQFPVLERHPVLLPACWARRIAQHLHDGNLVAYRAMMDYSDVSKEDLERTKRLFELAGCL